MDIKLGIIYIITNSVNHRQYVGQTARGLQFFENTYWGSGTIIKRAILKYGKDSFKKEILWQQENCSKDLLNSKEEFFIKKFKPSYNINDSAGGGNLGPKHQDLVKAGIKKLFENEEYCKIHSIRSTKRWDNVSIDERRIFAKRGWEKKSPEERKEIQIKIQKSIDPNFKIKALQKYHKNLSPREKEIRNKNISKGKKNSRRGKKVVCTETTEVFDSLTKASKHFQVDYTCIRRAADHPNSTSCGYHFHYLDVLQTPSLTTGSIKPLSLNAKALPTQDGHTSQG